MINHNKKFYIPKPYTFYNSIINLELLSNPL